MVRIIKFIIKIPLFLLRAYFGGGINKFFAFIEGFMILFSYVAFKTSPGEEDKLGYAILAFMSIIFAIHCIFMVANLFKLKTYR